MTLYQFRRLPKTTITVKTKTGETFDASTGTYTPTYSESTGYVYVGDMTTEEVKSLSVLNVLENNLVNTHKKIISLNEYDVDATVVIGSNDYRIALKKNLADTWIYGVERK